MQSGPEFTAPTYFLKYNLSQERWLFLRHHNEFLWHYTSVLKRTEMSSLDSIWKDRRLSTLIKIRTYFPLVQSVLLYASETWTLTSAESRSLEAFHMKCQRRLLRISCQQFVRNEEVRAQTGLSSVLDITSRRRISIFGHITRLQASVPARKAVAVHVSSSFCRPPDSSWRRRPGRPRGRWLDQIRRNTGQIPADH